MPLNVPATANIAALSAAQVWAYLPNRRLTSLALPDDIIKFVGKGTGTEVPPNTSLYDAILAIPTTPELEANALARYNALNALVAAIPTTPEPEANAALRYAALLAAILAIPTTPELEANAALRYAALLAAILAIPTTPELEADALARYTTLSTRLTAARAGYLDYLPNQRVEVAQVPATQNAVAVLNTTNETTLGSKDITVDIPTGATIESVIALARITIMNDSATAQKIDLKLNVEAVTLFSQADVVGFPAADGASSIYTIAEDASDEVTAIGQVVTLEALATLGAAASVRFQAQYFLFITYRMG